MMLIRVIGKNYYLTVIISQPCSQDDTSGKVMKAAKINAGFQIPMPIFCEIGDKIEIDTRTLEYKNRVK